MSSRDLTRERQVWGVCSNFVDRCAQRVETDRSRLVTSDERRRICMVRQGECGDGGRVPFHTCHLEASPHLRDEHFISQGCDEPLAVFREEDRSAGVDWADRERRGSIAALELLLGAAGVHIQFYRQVDMYEVRDDSEILAEGKTGNPCLNKLDILRRRQFSNLSGPKKGAPLCKHPESNEGAGQHRTAM